MKTIYINGMQCEHCKIRVEKALLSINGIVKVNVDLDNNNAVIECENQIDDNKIKEVIEDVGFEVSKIC